MNNFEFDLRQLLKNPGLESANPWTNLPSQPVAVSCRNTELMNAKKPVRTDASVKATRRSLSCVGNPGVLCTARSKRRIWFAHHG